MKDIFNRLRAAWLVLTSKHFHISSLERKSRDMAVWSNVTLRDGWSEYKAERVEIGLN